MLQHSNRSQILLDLEIGAGMYLFLETGYGSRITICITPSADQ